MVNLVGKIQQLKIVKSTTMTFPSSVYPDLSHPLVDTSLQHVFCVYLLMHVKHQMIHMKELAISSTFFIKSESSRLVLKKSDK